MNSTALRRNCKLFLIGNSHKTHLFVNKNHKSVKKVGTRPLFAKWSHFWAIKALCLETIAKWSHFCAIKALRPETIGSTPVCSRGRAFFLSRWSISQAGMIATKANNSVIAIVSTAFCEITLIMPPEVGFRKWVHFMEDGVPATETEGICDKADGQRDLGTRDDVSRCGESFKNGKWISLPVTNGQIMFLSL
ncbi:hypothetical protein AVEN_60521-1 [Araneus ventricosus]|uniref:Uncharacterized protein n=1 Tax=Araneus ventricosus TaxID=182803 RepID=A0A4Y2FTL4_ARAVE|nr:hypothetical protein AVEN_60521-1 [Araneus ventricosus]